MILSRHNDDLFTARCLYGHAFGDRNSVCSFLPPLHDTPYCRYSDIILKENLSRVFTPKSLAKDIIFHLKFRPGMVFRNADFDRFSLVSLSRKHLQKKVQLSLLGSRQEISNKLTIKNIHYRCKSSKGQVFSNSIKKHCNGNKTTLGGKMIAILTAIC